MARLKGDVPFGDDYRLGGPKLQARVGQIFREMGFQIKPGRESLEDFVVVSNAGLHPDKPLVLEVKSGSKKSGPSRKALRQLDDWVFDLSGEELTRKGISWCDMSSWAQGMPVLTSDGHPHPYKGVLIFNGPTNMRFEDRGEKWLGENERLFAEKRGFCVMSFQCLLSWHGKAGGDQQIAAAFWREIHKTHGEMPLPCP